MPMWNPWHGCHKISTGCRHCYVYREDAAFGTPQPSSEVRKTASFSLPLKRDRKKNWKYPSGTEFALCFTSDFLIEEADEWLDGIAGESFDGPVQPSYEVVEDQLIVNLGAPGVNFADRAGVESKLLEKLRIMDLEPLSVEATIRIRKQSISQRCRRRSNASRRAQHLTRRTV